MAAGVIIASQYRRYSTERREIIFTITSNNTTKNGN